MTLTQTQQLLNMLRASGVEHYKTAHVEITFSNTTQPIALKENDTNKAIPLNVPPASAVPPTEVEIPHHVNEVANLLKLSDNDLVDRLFPERS